MVVDENGKLMAGGVKKESTDEFVTLQCDYTINSNGYCIDGKTYGKYKGQDYLMYQIETGPLGNSLESEIQKLNQLMEIYEKDHVQ